MVFVMSTFSKMRLVNQSAERTPIKYSQLAKAKICCESSFRYQSLRRWGLSLSACPSVCVYLRLSVCAEGRGAMLLSSLVEFSEHRQEIISYRPIYEVPMSWKHKADDSTTKPETDGFFRLFGEIATDGCCLLLQESIDKREEKKKTALACHATFVACLLRQSPRQQPDVALRAHGGVRLPPAAHAVHDQQGVLDPGAHPVHEGQRRSLEHRLLGRLRAEHSLEGVVLLLLVPARVGGARRARKIEGRS